MAFTVLFLLPAHRFDRGTLGVGRPRVYQARAVTGSYTGELTSVSNMSIYGTSRWCVPTAGHVLPPRRALGCQPVCVSPLSLRPHHSEMASPCLCLRPSLHLSLFTDLSLHLRHLH